MRNRNLVNSFIEEISIYGINFVDVGSSGQFDKKWKKIQFLLNYFGFDPDAKECERQNNERHNFNSAHFFPTALHSYNGETDFNVTEDKYCSSVLMPNFDWLNRFEFHHKFKIESTEKINVTKLDSIKKLDGRMIDILKLDAQGLELPILHGAKEKLNYNFAIECENGFYKNYLNETTFFEIGQFLLNQGYIMFHLNPDHKIYRNNSFKNTFGSDAQPLWAESLWLKDYVSLYNNGIIKDDYFSRKQVQNIIIICAALNFKDFGLELCELFYKLKYLTLDELRLLQKNNSWLI